jgi:drug/metabolite transporter (DMT)-like permease
LLGVAPFMFGLESMRVEWTWGFVASLTYLVIGNSIIAIGLLLAMIRAGDVSRVSALFFLIPPMAAMIAWLLLGEVIAPQAWLGIGVAALGVFLATRNKN